MKLEYEKDQLEPRLRAIVCMIQTYHADTLPLEFMLWICRTHWRGWEMLWKLKLEKREIFDSIRPLHWLGRILPFQVPLSGLNYFAV